MSVQTQIERLNAIKERIRTNLVAQGVTVPADTMLEAMAEQILSVAGENGERGTGILKVSSSLTSYTTAIGGKNPIKRMALSTIKSEAGVDEVLVGDLISYSYYLYHIYYIDNSYAYMDTYVSIRGAAGSAGNDGTNGTDGKDGQDGHTPVKGVDYWTEADRASIVREVLESIGTPVFGIVDENNNIILNGELGDGTYTIKYEMEDGSTVTIGDLVLDTNVYYSVTNNLTQCTNSNSATEVVEGESYSATITPNSGYELKSVSVTMGGQSVSVSGGTINIAGVTGNIVITAVAEEIKAKYTNLADPTSADWADGKRFNGSGALTNVDAGVNGATTNYIGGDLATGDVIRIKGIDLTTYRTVVYDKNKNIASVGTLAGQTTYFSDITVNSTGASFKIKSGMPSGGYIRFCGPLNGTSADVIITKNEEIV